jgi:putative oxidoreductase
MIKKIFATDDHISGTILRVLLGLVFLPHGLQKLLGWFGGAGFSASLKGLSSGHNLPLIIAVLPILAESIGALALISGFFTRIAAFGIAVDMIVAVGLVHLKNGFFMNWGGKHPGEGFEYHILAVAIALALMIMGGGRWSVDRAIAKKLNK